MKVTDALIPKTIQKLSLLISLSKTVFASVALYTITENNYTSGLLKRKVKAASKDLLR